MWYMHLCVYGVVHTCGAGGRGVCVFVCGVVYACVCCVSTDLWVVCGVEVCVVHARVCMHVHMHIWKAEEGKEHLQLLVSTLFS